MEIRGTITQIKDQEVGFNNNRQWKRQGFVINTTGQYPQQLYLTAWGIKFNYELLQKGSEVILECDAQSTEYHGKWYTNLNARNISLETNTNHTDFPNLNESGSMLSDDLF